MRALRFLIQFRSNTLLMSVSLSTGVAATATLQFLDSNIENLDISDADGVEDWHERFEQYCLTNPLVDSSNKTAHYLTKIGKPGYRLLKDLAFPDPVASKDVNDLQKLLLAHLQPTPFQMAERERFHSLVRKPGESLRSFVLKVQQQAAKCNFGSSLANKCETGWWPE